MPYPAPDSLPSLRLRGVLRFEVSEQLWPGASHAKVDVGGVSSVLTLKANATTAFDVHQDGAVTVSYDRLILLSAAAY
jgi:hypothetical protein